MKVPLVDLTRQYHAMADEIDESIRDVLEAGQFVNGENVKAFETEFAAYCGTKYAVSVASGSDALRLSLAALEIARGEVITVPNTFISTVDAITHNNARPVFVDVRPENCNIDLGLVPRRINGHTKVILPVHMYGNPVEMDELMELASKRSLFVVEDACQAHGATYKKKKVGSFGICGCFSFYPTKDLGAYGDGGMVVTNDREVAERLRMLRNYGEKKRYQHALVGFNSRLDEIQAAILRVKLRHLEAWIIARQRVAEEYRELLADTPGVAILAETPNARDVYYLFVIETRLRNRLQEWLQKNNVITGIHYPRPIHLQKAYSHLGLSRGDFPVAEKASSQILSLPMFPELKREEVDYVCDSVKKFFTSK